ncbi:MAG: hypothetical protein AB7U35_12340 [Sphingobium sp.]
MTDHKYRKFLVSFTALAMTTQPALAIPANRLSDLVGARGSSGEMALESRGFTYITGHEGKHNKKHSYWWHSKDKNCIHVVTRDGRYSDITDTTNGDCNHKDGGVSTGAIAGAAVGAVLIAALLSHKSGHHDDGKHYANNADESQYERGYSDGLHNVSYHNYDRSDAYSKGFEEGVNQRQRNTGHHSGHGGYAPHVSVADLQGRDSIWAIDAIKERGFADVDAFTSGNTQYSVFYNRSTSQCVQMTFADGRVYDARDIGTHPRCS